MAVGNVILAFGLAIYLFSTTGSSAFVTMNVAVSDALGWKLGNWQLLINMILLCVEFIFGRHCIGWGTLVNGALLGYMISFFLDGFHTLFGTPETLVTKLLLIFPAAAVVAFGIAMYQTSNEGIAPYDYLALGMRDHLHLPYAGCRITTDGCCVAVAFLAHGNVGLGTLACACLTGPLVAFFTTHFIRKLIYGNEAG